MRRSLFALALVALACWPQARAQIIHPADNHATVSLHMARGSAGGSLKIWTQATGGRKPSDPELWGRNYWACLSASNPDTGACETSGEWSAAEGPTVIPLRFTEVESGMTIVLDVHAHSRWRWSLHSGDCMGVARQLRIAAAAAAECYGKSNDEKQLTAFVPASELARLPFAGTWKANLHLRLGLWSTGWLANFTAAIDIKVSDAYQMQVYLPEFGTATPLVDLNLQSRPSVGGATASGERVVDACLYDGFDANSDRYTVRISDPASSAGDETGRFFVRHTTPDGAAAANRIEYEVRSTTAGLGTTQYQSGQERIFTGIADAARRVVSLPHVPHQVFCTPWPLTLKTPEFAHAEKRAGQYRGVLRIEFSASTMSP